MIIMSQKVNGKQTVSENNRLHATTATAKRFSSTDQAERARPASAASRSKIVLKPRVRL
jgi:hypothetical protein